MPNFYGREWTINIYDETTDKNIITFNNTRLEGAAKEDADLRITFNVTIDSGGYISYLDLSLYNLSLETMNFLSKSEKKYPKIKIVLACGYKHSYNGIVFIGRIKNHIITRKDNDIVYRILASSNSPQSMSKTMPANSSLSDIIPVVAQFMKLKPQFNPDDFKDNSSYPRGYNLQGDPNQIMRKLAKQHNFKWVSEKNNLVVYRSSKPIKNAVINISTLTGMEGVPEITETGCTVTTRLRLDLTIGGKFQVDSNYAQANFSGVYFLKLPEEISRGTYNVLKLEHSGDTYGDLWSTTVTGTISSVS